MNTERPDFAAKRAQMLAANSFDNGMVDWLQRTEKIDVWESEPGKEPAEYRVWVHNDEPGMEWAGTCVATVHDEITANLVADALRHLKRTVKCVDCEQWVPFEQVRTGNPKCASNIGATGVQYGHRIERALYEALEADQ